jgi:hypothetical protein
MKLRELSWEYSFGELKIREKERKKIRGQQMPKYEGDVYISDSPLLSKLGQTCGQHMPPFADVAADGKMYRSRVEVCPPA